MELKRGFIAEIGSRLFSETSVGDVQAPCDHSHLDHTRPGNFCVACGQDVSPNVLAERAAVVKYLRVRAGTCADRFWGNMVDLWADAIEKGEHHEK